MTQQFKLGGGTWSGKRVYSSTWVDGIVQYNIVITDEDGNLIAHEKTSDTSFKFTLDKPPIKDTKYNVDVYYAYSIAPIQSNTIHNEVTIKGVIPDPHIEPTPDPEPDPGEQNT